MAKKTVVWDPFTAFFTNTTLVISPSLLETESRSFVWLETVKKWSRTIILCTEGVQAPEQRPIETKGTISPLRIKIQP